MRVSRAEQVLEHVILLAFTAFALTPVLVILATAMSPRLGVAGGIHPGNFVDAWRIGGFASSLGHSLVVAVIVVAGATVCAVLSGYAFGTMRFRGATPLFYLFLLGLMIPAEATVIPLHFDLRSLGLLDTYAAIALPQMAQSIAFGTFWMRAQMRAIPPSLIEAAALDGAGPLRTLTRVVVPAALPSIVTMVVLLVMWTWNEFLIALVMAPGGRLRTAPLGLATFQGQYTADLPLLSAGAVIIALPTVALFLLLQRHVIRGMLEGAAR